MPKVELSLALSLVLSKVRLCPGFEFRYVLNVLFNPVGGEGPASMVSKVRFNGKAPGLSTYKEALNI